MQCSVAHGPAAGVICSRASVAAKLAEILQIDGPVEVDNRHALRIRQRCRHTAERAPQQDLGRRRSIRRLCDAFQVVCSPKVSGVRRIDGAMDRNAAEPGHRMRLAVDAR